jgi:hypothetical protein
MPGPAALSLEQPASAAINASATTLRAMLAHAELARAAWR